jgi:hypothetical protein
MPRKLKFDMSQIKRLVPNMGGCLATNRITVDGVRVGFMYREHPSPEVGSGWHFLAGDESEEYVNDLDHTTVCLVNTICNHDPDIIPYLNAPYGSVFVRDPDSGKFVRGEFKPAE